MFLSQPGPFQQWTIRCCLLLALVQFSQAAAMAQYEADVYHFGFPITQTAEAFSGQPTVVNVRFQFYFPVDDQRYLPVSEELAARLASPPTVSSDPNMRVRVLRTVCERRSLKVMMGQDVGAVIGGEIASQIEITPDSSVTQGAYLVTLDYAAIDLTAEIIHARIPAKAEVRIKVDVWPSQAAKQEAARLAQEKRIREEALEAQARYEARLRFLKNSSPFLAVALLTGFLVFLYRKWIWPDLTFRLAAGESEQHARAVPTIGREDSAEPGTILQTLWARNRIGRRQRIKIETFVSEEKDERRARKLDLLISVGKSVASGHYLAKGPNGAVKIIVR